jgi:endonuclease/exonuclease/phosphatase family metal-dependent hydrolase
MTRIAQRLGALALVLSAALLLGCGAQRDQQTGNDLPITNLPPPTDPGPGSYSLCFWNVENLFDDQDDGRTGPGDRDYDPWMAGNPEVRETKLAHLCEVLLGQNLSGGRGPDILAVAEVESDRAVEMLQEALNRRLRDQIGDPKLFYTTILWENPGGHRNIGTAILTRLPVVKDRTRLLGKHLRILEGHVKVAGQELVVIASHWSSRISDKTGRTRGHYGDQIYGRFRAMYKRNPKVDLLVCGDFNDNPDDPSVTEHLRAIGDEAAVREGGDPPNLLNLFASAWKRGAASLFNGAKPYLFDQVCVSPGLLDREGWSVDVASARVVEEMWYSPRGRYRDQKRPNRFGGPRDKRPLSARGASDHFPVVVRLSVR